MAKVLCIYHANCADGFGAAWVVRRVLGDGVEFCPASYGSPPPDVTGRDVLMVDFSYKRPVIEKMRETARSILIFDHHKSAADDLSDYPAPPVWEKWRKWNPDPRIVSGLTNALFDMERSGAGLTWDFFFHPQARPPLINHIEDRDLWRFKLPGTREIHSVLMSLPYDFPQWDGVDKQLRLRPTTIIAEGIAIDRAHLKNVRDTLKTFAMRATIAGHDVPVCNMPYHMASDAGNIMSEGEKFAATYIDGPKGRGYSLRSQTEGFDVSDIAKLFGGGGHKNAAGFTVPHGADVSKAGGLAAVPVAGGPNF